MGANDKSLHEERAKKEKKTFIKKAVTCRNRNNEM